MKILALSDQIIHHIHSPHVRQRFKEIDLIISCGDLAYYYLEYVLNALDVSLYFVRGNHDKVVEFHEEGQRTKPRGGIDLHRRHCNHQGLLIAGIEGSLRYRPGKFQYSQNEMWALVLGLVPGLMVNRIRHGRFLDLFVSHAPPQGIHDMPDLPHQGINAFRWLVDVFQPAYFIHGHVHVYRPDTILETLIGRTRVVNAFGFAEIELEITRSGNTIR